MLPENNLKVVKASLIFFSDRQPQLIANQKKINAVRSHVRIIFDIILTFFVNTNVRAQKKRNAIIYKI